MSAGAGLARRPRRNDPPRPFLHQPSLVLLQNDSGCLKVLAVDLSHLRFLLLGGAEEGLLLHSGFHSTPKK